MDWLRWAIPLIAVAVWILANLARPPKEAPRRPGRRPGPPSREGESSRPTVQRDLDRFLKEVSKGRRQAEKRPPPLPEPPAAVPPEERRRRAAEQRRDAVVASRPTSRPGPPTGAPDLPKVLPLPRPRREPPAVAAPPALLPPAPPAEVIEVPDQPPTITPAPARSATVLQLLALLSNPRSLPTAFLLQEVLKPPLSQRRRRPRA